MTAQDDRSFQSGTRRSRVLLIEITRDILAVNDTDGHALWRKSSIPPDRKEPANGP